MTSGVTYYVYATCDDTPDYGCIYEGFGAFNEGFDASDCESYGGTPCEEEIPGCLDESANNYNADANVDDGSVCIQNLYQV